MLCVLAFVIGFFLGGITVSLLREEVKKAEGLGKGTEVKGSVTSITSGSPLVAPSAESIADMVLEPSSTPPRIIQRDSKKMCRATGIVPPSFVVKPTGIPFRCPKCCKTVGRRGPLLTKRALKSHMLKCSA